MDKQRARNAEDKAFRKQSIIQALRELLGNSLQPLPSASDIAKKAGVSKGVIYIYFETREEIFLALHLEDTLRFFHQVDLILDPGSYRLEKIKKGIVQFFLSEEIFVYLGILIPAMMETNVRPDIALEYKKEVAAGMERMVERWMAVEPDLKREGGRDFLLRYYFLAMMLWQHHHPHTKIRELAEESLWLLEGDLEKSLTQSFDWLWTGMVQEKKRK